MKSVPTPEFVQWAVAQSCELREDDDPQDLFAIERRLRPFQEYAIAKKEGRLFEGICVARNVDRESTTEQQPLGFAADEVLDLAGGDKHLQTICGRCAANVWMESDSVELAGCFGQLIGSTEGPGFAERFETAIRKTGLESKFDSLCERTSPRWYGVWYSNLADSHVAHLVSDILLKMSDEMHPEGGRVEIQRVAAAITKCANTECSEPATAKNEGASGSLRLVTRLFPAGRRDERFWYLPARCPQCGVAKQMGRRKCDVCQLVDAALPPRKRHVRGNRPYWPLEKFLGREQTCHYLERYRVHLERKQRRPSAP